MYEMPPILQGTEQQQISALRDYLVRLIRSNNIESSDDVITTQIASSIKESQDVKNIQDNADQLRQLILKTADDLLYKSGLIEDLDGNYDSLAAKVEDIGNIQEEYSNEFETNAKNVIEKYDFTEIITAVTSDSTEAFATFKTTMEGQIRRGWLYVPDPSNPGDYIKSFGIVISQSVQFEAEVPTELNGENYYHISDHQTFGFYTSTGWEFWIGGEKRGWFDSGDGMLHVINIVSENSFKLSAGWEMTSSGGFGIKYIGE